MQTLKHVHHIDNLSRAWRWILSNPDAGYKNFFRSFYLNYSIADTSLLADLRDRLHRGVYEPAPACKIYHPKPSGLLRPMTLLTVEDQIVYQAMVNVIAGRLLPRVRARYNNEVFGHVLAKPDGIWFYQNWKHSYARFNAAARKAHADGFVFAANFDLTSFYDSLDHGVLAHFLKGLKCDKDFLELLIRCLNTWTSTQGTIYHNHGIPQGPLSSGLLSEVVLQHFDQNHRAPNTVKYFRYVDDIRLFAKSMADLRRVVTWLDMLSKEVGLFPQSSKIHLHEVTDIEAELKKVSRPFEGLLEDEEEDDPGIDQGKLRKKLIALSREYRVSNSTEFKFLLAFADPSGKLNTRLWKVLENHPELAGNILRHFQQYVTLPLGSGNRLVAALQARPRFPSVIAELLRTAEGRVNAQQAAQIDAFVNAWLADGSVPGADYLAAIMKWGIRRDLIARRSIPSKIRKLPAWWAQGEVLPLIDGAFMPMTATIMNEHLTAAVSDVAIAAAVHIEQLKIPVSAKLRTMQRSAACILEQFNVIRRNAVRVCGIRRFFEELVREQHDIDWKKMFGKKYRRVEQQTVWCRAFARNDITAFVNGFDVFNDFLLHAICKHDSTMPKYVLGTLGSIMVNTKLNTDYPRVMRMAKEIHDKRGQSALSHPVKTKGRVVVGPTGRIKFAYLKRARAFAQQALSELEAKKKW